MKTETRVVSAGRHPEQHFGAVNPPVYHASTIVRRSMAEWREVRTRIFDDVVYGRFGTPTTKAFEEAVAALEGADRAVAVSSGMAACAAAILSVVKGGDHILVTDSAYQPVRKLAENFLKPFGVETTYYDPAIGAGIAALIRDNTSLIWLEAPGSQTMEMQDIPAITAVARERGVRTGIDNTWATPLLFKPLDFGVDLSVNAATKYLVGHSDAMLGVVSMRAELFEKTKITANFMGSCPGSEECYLGLRGLRTLAVRLRQHEENALRLAHWFQGRPEVNRVLYPALPDDPGHAIWQRDFSGASGLFSVILEPADEAQVAALVDGLEHFGLGASWGGYESLVLPFDPTDYRTVTEWRAAGPCLRFHIGLENPDDLIADLEAGFDRLRAAG
ncbi:MAG: cystathionine beta-lyase [Rhodospirillaceae bacterium]|nr:cystathionine beta-lyase [Rhodospirillaceae bacterium]MYI49964.1 cystathionine beta-lyase [Rhodospirillaceae bacterium]